MTQHTELIATLRTHAMFDYCTTGNEAADAIEALEAEVSYAKADALSNARIAVAYRSKCKELEAQIAAAQGQEPIYQYLRGDGAWIDQTKNSYEYNLKGELAVLRVVYAAPIPQQAQPERIYEAPEDKPDWVQPERAPLSDAEIDKHWTNATIELCSFERCYKRGFKDAERIHGIKQGSQHD